MPDELSQDDIDALLNTGAPGGGGGAPGGELSGADLDALLGSVRPMNMPDFGAVPEAGAPKQDKAPANSIEMLYDVEMTVRVRLGRTFMTVEDILRLHEGSVVTFEKEAGPKVDILVNGRLVAYGEVLVLNDFFCVRVTEVLSNRERAVLASM